MDCFRWRFGGGQSISSEANSGDSIEGSQRGRRVKDGPMTSQQAVGEIPGGPVFLESVFKKWSAEIILIDFTCLCIFCLNLSTYISIYS